MLSIVQLTPYDAVDLADAPVIKYPATVGAVAPASSSDGDPVTRDTDHLKCGGDPVMVRADAQMIPEYLCSGGPRRRHSAKWVLVFKCPEFLCRVSKLVNIGEGKINSLIRGCFPIRGLGLQPSLSDIQRLDIGELGVRYLKGALG